MYDRIKVLVADDSKDFRELLVEFLSNEEDLEVVAAVGDGFEACEMVNELKPDVVIIEVVLPHLDGLAVLKTIKNLENSPACVMTSRMNNDIITQKSYDLGADYYLVKPYNLDVLSERISLFGRLHKEIPLTDSTLIKPQRFTLEARITDVLHEIKVPTHIRGYQYVREAIMMAVIDFDITNYITKGLYASIAKKCKTTPSRVERSIRHAIDSAWQRSNSRENKPTNGEFIATIADNIRVESGMNQC